MKLLISLLICFATSQASWENLNLTIAVIEYQPLENKTLSSSELVDINAQKYVEIIKSIGQLDLIVFPEATLRTNPETAVEIRENENPCDSSLYPIMMTLISCAARNAKTYVVINLVEKLKCALNTPTTNCQKTGFSFYNTDLVFDRDGTIIARYRKYNLFGEYELDRPEIAESVVFHTDFGMTFGIFTCFDILFKSPAEDLLDKNIDGVIFPTMWFSELPFLTAIQAQQMWSHAHNISLFAAGANNPSVGSGGSGIYNGNQGVILSDIVSKGGTEVLIFSRIVLNQLPKNIDSIDKLAKRLDEFYLLIDPSLVNYSSIVLNPGKVENQVCHNEFCCQFNIETSFDALSNDLRSYTYLLVAYSGVRSFSGVYNGGIDVCGMIACLNSTLASCGRRFANYDEIQWPLTFEKIEIKANFVDDGNRTQYPNSLLSSLRPIDPPETIWTGNQVGSGDEKMMERKFEITKPQNRILTFAIFGRNFGLDSAPTDDNDDDNNSVESLGFSFFLLIGISAYQFFNEIL